MSRPNVDCVCDCRVTFMTGQHFPSIRFNHLRVAVAPAAAAPAAVDDVTFERVDVFACLASIQSTLGQPHSKDGPPSFPVLCLCLAQSFFFVERTAPNHRVVCVSRALQLYTI